MKEVLGFVESLMIIALALICFFVSHDLQKTKKIQREQATNIRAIYNCIGNPAYTGVTPHDESTLIRQCMDDVRGR